MDLSPKQLVSLVSMYGPLYLEALEFLRQMGCVLILVKLAMELDRNDVAMTALHS